MRGVAEDADMGLSSGVYPVSARGQIMLGILKLGRLQRRGHYYADQ